MLSNTLFLTSLLSAGIASARMQAYPHQHHVRNVGISDSDLGLDLGASTNAAIGKRGLLDINAGECVATSLGVGGSLLGLVGLDDLNASLCVCAKEEVHLGKPGKTYTQPPKLECPKDEQPTCELEPICVCKPGFQRKDGQCKPVNCPANAVIECNGAGCRCECDVDGDGKGDFNCEPLIEVGGCAQVEADVAANLCHVDILDVAVDVCVCADIAVGGGGLLNYHRPHAPECVGGELTCSTSPECHCPPGHVLKDGKCIGGPSGVAQSRKRAVAQSLAARRACPAAEEEACPISSSKASTGFECINTLEAVESCGGCVTQGKGTNCLELPNVFGVGCEKGACKILSCLDGFSLLDGSCVGN